MSNFCHPLIMPNFCHQKRTLLLKEFPVILSFRIVFTRHYVISDWQKVFFFEQTYETGSRFRCRFLRSEIFLRSDNIFVRLNFFGALWVGGGHVRIPRHSDFLGRFYGTILTSDWQKVPNVKNYYRFDDLMSKSLSFWRPLVMSNRTEGRALFVNLRSQNIP